MTALSPCALHNASSPRMGFPTGILVPDQDLEDFEIGVPLSDLDHLKGFDDDDDLFHPDPQDGDLFDCLDFSGDGRA